MSASVVPFGGRDKPDAFRPMPKSPALEQSILGTLLFAPDVMRSVVSVLRTEHFTEQVHRKIFDTLLSQFEAGRAGDLGAVAASLRVVWHDPVTEGVTLGQYVAGLAEYSTAPQFLARQAHDLRDLWAMREILAAAERPTFVDGESPRDQLAAVFDRVDQVRGALVETVGNRGSAGQIAYAAVTEMLELRDGVRQQAGATTGFTDVDQRMLGYRPGELVVVAARPGMGKTTFATSSLLQSAAKGNGGLLFSMELPQPSVAARMISDVTYGGGPAITHSQIRSAQASDEEQRRIEKAAEYLERLPIETDFSTRLSVAEIGLRVASERKRMEAKGIRLGVVMIDYLKFLKATDRYRGQRTYEVGEITAGLKEIAKENEVCVVLLAQLNRGTEAQADKRPDLQHLRESGDIESDADVVMFLYREAYYLEKSTEYRNGEHDAINRMDEVKNLVEVLIAKNRNGPTGTVNLFCDIGASAIRNADRSAQRYGRPA